MLQEKTYFSPELIEYLEIKETPEALKTLTDTEMKVFKLIAQNKTANSIVLYAKKHERFLSEYT